MMKQILHMPKLQLIDQAGNQVTIDKSRFFIGHAACCDLVINDHFIHNIHAIIFYQDNQFTIQDLHTSSGLFIDGVKVNLSPLLDQSQLSIGSHQFQIFIDNDVLVDQLDTNPAADLTEVSTHYFEQNIPDNFKFDDSPLASISNLIHRQLKLEFNADIQNEINQKPDIELLEKTDTHYTFDVSIYIGECIYQHQQLKMNRKSILAGDICAFAFNNPKDIIAHCDQDNAYFTPIDNYDLLDTNLCHVSEKTLLRLGEHIVYQKGAISIVIKLLEIDQKLKPVKLFEFDRDFNKILAGLFAVFFIPLLSLLLFYQEKPEEPKKEVAIIYQLQPSDLPPAPTVAKKAEQNNENAPKPTPDKPADKPAEKKLVKTEPTKTEAPVKNVMVKKFAFKSEVKLDQIDTPKDVKFDNFSSQQLQARSPSSVKSLNFSDTKEIGRVNGKIEGVASGSDRGKVQAGGKLSDKNSFDSSYIEPRTVVLGSIDPELLRKILREYIPQFRHCYQQELLQNDKIKGILDLDFTITQVGKASKINVLAKDSSFSGRGQDCMRRVLSLIDFPKPKGGGIVEVRQPLNFMAERRQL
jgi:pSer/pThr/pTyr-binding forkhead associated (FHA) protein